MKKSIKSAIVFILVMFTLGGYSHIAHAAKGFVVEKVGSDKILISDGYSEYIIEHDYSCYSTDFYEGETIYIDTSYSPSYGDKIIIPSYSDTVCEVTTSDEVNIKRYYVDDVFDSEDKIIVTDKNNDRFLVEYGIGCGLSMWRYEGKTVDIDIGGSFLDGIGDRIYLFDSGRDCKVWDADELSGSDGGSIYIPPATPTCPENASPINGQCACNKGYKPNGSVCITNTQSCQNQYGVNSYGDDQHCYCSAGYQWNTAKTACVKIPSCSDGYVLNTNNQCVTYTQNCQDTNNSDANIVGTKGEGGKINCDCVFGYHWNGSKCVINIVVSDIQKPIVESKKAGPLTSGAPKKLPSKLAVKGLKIKSLVSSSTPSSIKKIITSTNTTESIGNSIVPKILWYKKVSSFVSGFFK